MKAPPLILKTNVINATGIECI